MQNAQRQFEMSGELKASFYNAVLYHHLSRRSAFLYQSIAAGVTLFSLVPLFISMDSLDHTSLFIALALILALDLMIIWLGPRAYIRSNYFLDDDEPLRIT